MVPAVELKVSSRSQGDHELVVATGEIDLYTAPRLQSELAAVIASAAPASRVVIDMSGVEFCDSTGMNVLLSCLRQARERGGELELAAPRPAVRKILSVTGLDAVFTVQLSHGGRPPVPPDVPASAHKTACCSWASEQGGGLLLHYHRRHDLCSRRHSRLQRGRTDR
jgi:anti-sigma B factor antagonist